MGIYIEHNNICIVVNDTCEVLFLYGEGHNTSELVIISRVYMFTCNFYSQLNIQMGINDIRIKKICAYDEKSSEQLCIYFFLFFLILLL